VLELLYEPGGLAAFELPAGLAERYGGTLGFDGPRVFANFVSTVDGVVAVPGLARSNRLIADDSDDDRFVMALLRACADAILIGSGTLQGSPRSLWTPESAYPAAAGGLAELRRLLGRPSVPELVVVTASGTVDPAHPALERGAVVVTTDAGARALRRRLPAAVEVAALGDGPAVDPAAALGLLRDRGRERVLAEAGPHLAGSLLAAGLVDELFLTLSPVVAGRTDAAARLGLVAGVELLPAARVSGRLLGIRRGGEHLFLRYELDYGDAGRPA
jgi:riboflavin biosynthesis pyrimidine reductase